ncbi:MAG TPA: hypothetical protein VGH47_04250 [Xanthobacteraceae bacterium]|jgi:hypothetical protein
MTAATCPHCGQRILTRHGVRLSPLLSEIFGVIEKAGEHGVTAWALMVRLYPGLPDAQARARIKSNVWRINNCFSGTNIRVRLGGKLAPYRVVRIRQMASAASGARE